LLYQLNYGKSFLFVRKIRFITKVYVLARLLKSYDSSMLLLKTSYKCTTKITANTFSLQHTAFGSLFVCLSSRNARKKPVFSLHKRTFLMKLNNRITNDDHNLMRFNYLNLLITNLKFYVSNTFQQLIKLDFLCLIQQVKLRDIFYFDPTRSTNTKWLNNILYCVAWKRYVKVKYMMGVCIVIDDGMLQLIILFRILFCCWNYVEA
jgi:hypothetical protein